MGRVGEEPRVTELVNNPQEVEEPLFFETPSPGPDEESRNMGPNTELCPLRKR